MPRKEDRKLFSCGGVTVIGGWIWLLFLDIGVL